MKKLFCALLAGFCILSVSLGENAGFTSAPDRDIQLVTPTPSAAPPGTIFSGEGLTVTLPTGFEILDEAERAGYDAAVQADYPNGARTLMAAVNADAGAALCFSAYDTALDASQAAQEAAQKILGSTISISDAQYGGNSYSSFICAIGEQIYQLYYLAGEEQMLVIGISGLTDTEIENLLTGLTF